MTEYSIPLLMKIRVRDSMTRRVVTVSPEDPVMRAAELMAKYEIRGLPVVKDGILEGIITFSDILRLPADKRD